MVFFCNDDQAIITRDSENYFHVDCPQCRKYFIRQNDIDKIQERFDPLEIPIIYSDWFNLRSHIEEVRIDEHTIQRISDYYSSLTHQDECDIFLLFFGSKNQAEVTLTDAIKRQVGSFVGALDEEDVNYILTNLLKSGLIDYHGWHITDPDIIIELTKKGRSRYNKLKRENKNILNFHNLDL